MVSLPQLLSVPPHCPIYIHSLSVSYENYAYFYVLLSIIITIDLEKLSTEPYPKLPRLLDESYSSPEQSWLPGQPCWPPYLLQEASVPC